MLQLIELYEQTEGHPSDPQLASLRERLLERAAPRYWDDKSFRSVSAIRSQLSWVRLLATDSPTAWRAPAAFRGAWELHRGRRAGFIIDEPSVLSDGHAVDRVALVRVLEHLRTTLNELVRSPDYLPERLREHYVLAWTDLEDRGHIAQAIVALRGPAVDDLLGVIVKCCG